MYHRLEQAPSSDKIVPLISVIRVRHGPRSLCWLSHCIASERDCEPWGLYPDSLQPIESVPRNFNEHTRVDFLPKDKWSYLLRNKWIPPPPLELWLRKRLVCVCVRCFCIAHHSSKSRFSAGRKRSHICTWSGVKKIADGWFACTQQTLNINICSGWCALTLILLPTF